jgi:hypothetical protein
MDAYRVLVGRLEGKRSLERSGCKWKNSIKKDCREIGWCGMDWINLAEGRDQW